MQTLRSEILKHLPQRHEARRLFHGRGHTFPGLEDLVIDSFHPVVMVTLYRSRPQAWLEDLVSLLDATLPEPAAAILLQERFLANGPCRLLRGALPEEPQALEDGLVYRLRLGDAQNIGFFPDMAVGRRLVRARATRKKVLNLFAYSCSFSVAALAGGAEQVTNLDMNRGALALGKLNHQLNGIDLRRAGFLPLELFRSFGKLRKLGPFDLIICDPPATQGKSFTAAQHWPKLVRSLPALAASGAEVLACLNAPHLGPDFLDDLFARHLPRGHRIGLYTPGDDFPETDPARGVTLHLYRMP